LVNHVNIVFKNILAEAEKTKLKILINQKKFSSIKYQRKTRCQIVLITQILNLAHFYKIFVVVVNFYIFE